MIFFSKKTKLNPTNRELQQDLEKAAVFVQESIVRKRHRKWLRNISKQKKQLTVEIMTLNRENIILASKFGFQTKAIF